MNHLISLWHQLSPWPFWQDETLQSIAAYLNQPATRTQLELFEREQSYPQPIRIELQALGLSEFFAEPPATADAASRPGGSKVTTAHLCALNEIIAGVNTSLAVTVGVNPFALLPVYIAADPEQLAWIFERVRSGAFGAMLLTEIENGSNLLRNQTQAEPGAIDQNGEFRTWSDLAHVNGRAAPTHYRLSGRKDLINGGSKHELLVVFARTRKGEAHRDGLNPLAARSDFSFLVVEREPSVSSPQRWRTVPVPAADIASVQFCHTLIPVSCRIGPEGNGFSLAQKTLAISRGGVSAFAAGLAGRAVALATSYAQERRIYGGPILQLGAIADHLLRMKALELLVSAMSVKAAAALNAYGFGAAHYGAVAKYACCVLTEELVTEGRYLHGSRSFLADHPYQRLNTDAALLSTFDGTTHLVLDQIQWRLEQMAILDQTEEVDWTEVMAAIYRTPPQSLVKITRVKTTSLLIHPVAYLLQLARLSGELSLQPLVELSRSLLALTRHCRATNSWENDQGLRFEAGKLLAYIETLIALVELADPTRRKELGLAPLPATERLQPLLIFTYGWFGGQVAAALRTLIIRAGLTETAELDQVEQTFGQLYAEGRNIIRNHLHLLTGSVTSEYC